ncbi:hypothetical protein GTH32_01260 [Alteromonas sp. 345S023]|uniref:Uncharacterized protein n=1 Tax=Alteromonas profundi TaxID=2696062 RepID=A0A7X5RJF3_9ALTE|nr:hypothetical protein [Alteromonas profundi]NDV89823.1 hypothetical protein [Alteromonas profundi]
MMNWKTGNPVPEHIQLSVKPTFKGMSNVDVCFLHNAYVLYVSWYMLLITVVIVTKNTVRT